MGDFYTIVVGYGLSALRILFLGLLGYYGTVWLRQKMYTCLSRMYPDELRSIFIARIVSYAFLFVIITALLHEFGLNLAALLGAAGILGFAVAYASQTSISNIISGLFLAVERPFEVHDILIIDGIEGTVEKVNLFAVTLRTPIGTLVRVPHEQLLKHTFINVTRLPLRRFDMTLRIAPNQDIAKAIHIIEQVANHNAWCDKNNTRIEVQELSGNYLTIVIGVWSKQDHVQQVKNTLPLELKHAFDKHNIQLSTYYPYGDLHAR